LKQRGGVRTFAVIKDSRRSGKHSGAVRNHRMDEWRAVRVRLKRRADAAPCSRALRGHFKVRVRVTQSRACLKKGRKKGS